MPVLRKRGLKAAKPGKDTSGALEKELSFSSEFNTFKFKKMVKIKLPLASAINTAPVIRYKHELGYPPSYLIYVLNPDGSLDSPDAASLGSYADDKEIGVIYNKSSGLYYVILLIGADNLETDS